MFQATLLRLRACDVSSAGALDKPGSGKRRAVVQPMARASPLNPKHPQSLIPRPFDSLQ